MTEPPIGEDDRPRFRLAAGGGSRMPSPERVLYRLRAGVWVEDPGTGTVPVDDQVRAALNANRATADHLDAGVLATEDVRTMSLEEVDRAFGALIEDRRILLSHGVSQEDGMCPIDETPFPCADLQRTLVHYASESE